MRFPMMLDGEARAIQREFDDAYWDHAPGQPTVEHSCLHLGILSGEFAEYCARVSAGQSVDPAFLRTKLVPELISQALRLANDPTVAIEDIDQALVDRWRELAWRSGPPADADSVFSHPPDALLGDYATDKLSPEVRGWVNRHMVQCDGCRTRGVMASEDAGT